jgi:hypothetical protein
MRGSVGDVGARKKPRCAWQPHRRATGLQRPPPVPSTGHLPVTPLADDVPYAARRTEHGTHRMAQQDPPDTARIVTRWWFVRAAAVAVVTTVVAYVLARAGWF